MPADGGNTVQGFYDALLSTMKNGRALGQNGRFAQLDPIVRRTFDIAAMARLSVGPSWSSLTETQRQQVTESAITWLGLSGESSTGEKWSRQSGVRTWWQDIAVCDRRGEKRSIFRTPA